MLDQDRVYIVQGNVSVSIRYSMDVYWGWSITVVCWYWVGYWKSIFASGAWQGNPRGNSFFFFFLFHHQGSSLNVQEREIVSVSQIEIEIYLVRPFSDLFFFFFDSSFLSRGAIS